MKKVLFIILLVISISMMVIPFGYAIYNYSTASAEEEIIVAEETPATYSIYLPSPFAQSMATSNTFTILSSFKFDYNPVDRSLTLTTIDPDTGLQSTLNNTSTVVTSTGFDVIRVMTSDTANSTIYTYSLLWEEYADPNQYAFLGFHHAEIHYSADTLHYLLYYNSKVEDNGVLVDQIRSFRIRFSPSAPLYVSGLNGWISSYIFVDNSLNNDAVFDEGYREGQSNFENNILPGLLDDEYWRGYGEGQAAGFDPFSALLTSVDRLLNIEVLPNITFGKIFSISFGLILLGIVIKVFLGG